MHKRGQAFGFCLADKVSKPVWVAREGVEEVVVLDAQFILKNMLFILHTVSVAFSADS